MASAFSASTPEQVMEQLKFDSSYAKCSTSCFSGASECKPTPENKTPVKCTERKKEISEAMKVFSRKIKMELALGDDNSGLINVNLKNAVAFSKDEHHKDKFINQDLHDIEAGAPNPVGKVNLSERELTEARRRLAVDHKNLEEEFKTSGSKNYADWMSRKLLDKIDDHKASYFELIKQQAPIFSVIDRPAKLAPGEDPVWSDAQIAKALVKMSERSIVPVGQIVSPYDACKYTTIVSQEKYLENKFDWDQFSRECNVKIQVAEDTGVSAINPLNEGAKYLLFAHRVAQKVKDNLKKNRDYAECSASCFKGAPVCINITRESKKPIQCSERKKEVLEAMKVFSRRIRMELALSSSTSGLTEVNITNAIQYSKDEHLKNKYINSNMYSFEMGLPNPLGDSELSERELSMAKRRLTLDHEKVEEESKKSADKNNPKWVSLNLLKKMDDHKARYRELIYQEAPIFSVIDKPTSLKKGEDPVWSDEQISKAFLKISENAKATEQKVNWSLNNSKLEFSRSNGEALGKWLSKDKNDLLYYVGMKNPVEDVLAEDASLCGIATSMQTRLHSKEMQNGGLTLATVIPGAGLAAGAIKVGSKVVTYPFVIARALSGAEATGLTGMGLGSVFLKDSIGQYTSKMSEAESVSGLGGDKESKSLRTSEEIDAAKDGVKMSLAFLPLDIAGGSAVGKAIYTSLAKKMTKDLPELGALLKNANLTPAARDQAVDKWLAMKVKSAVKSGVLREGDEAALKSSESKGVLETLTAEITKANPNFFKNQKNMDYFLKLVATTVKKEKGDPADLGIKAKELLLHFNTDALEGVWDPKSQNALFKVFDNAIEELRLAAKNDPETYLKFSSNAEAQNKIIAKALRKAGVEEKNIPAGLQCAMPVL